MNVRFMNGLLQGSFINLVAPKGDDVTRAFLKDYGLNIEYVTQLLPPGMKSFTSVKYQASGSSS